MNEKREKNKLFDIFLRYSPNPFIFYQNYGKFTKANAKVQHSHKKLLRILGDVLDLGDVIDLPCCLWKNEVRDSIKKHKIMKNIITELFYTIFG